MKTSRYIDHVVILIMAASCSCAHTTSESNMVVRSALSYIAHSASCQPDLDVPLDEDSPITWQEFLGGNTNGWTLSEKKAAFNWYLGMLGTKDCSGEGFDEEDEIDAAISCCRVLNYTNAVSALKALALNPKGVCRSDAIEFTIQFSAVDFATTEFVETIITNVSGYSSGERVSCYWEYAKKLRQDPCTNSVCASALSMFYRNRKVSGTGAATLDRLFADKIDGYALSSNRLDTALSMLMVTNMRPQFVEYFTGVTNQLLSSGQQLPWINVGMGGN